MTLDDFLLARIAEDEAAAERASSFTPWTETFQTDNYGHLTVQPTRVLAECEAKRRIVEAVAEVNSGPAHPETLLLGDDVLSQLARPYADHPDYREEWKP